MGKITYREICREDHNSIKKLIDEVWNLNQFCGTTQGLEDSLNIYLQSSLLDISYGKVAISTERLWVFCWVKMNVKKYCSSDVPYYGGWSRAVSRCFFTQAD